VTTKQEQWQHDILLGLNRLLEVLHDISDTVHATHVLLRDQERAAVKEPPTRDDGEDRLLNVEETCEFLGVSRSQIYGTFRQIGPKPIKIGKRTMYRKADLRAWLDARQDLRIDRGIATEPVRVHTPRLPMSSYRPLKDRPDCKGSWSEPVRVNKWQDGECRHCGNFIRRRNNGTLVKHKQPITYF
jgi:predicted DNA-binding transcriptional regulator AlpA